MKNKLFVKSNNKLNFDTMSCAFGTFKVLCAFDEHSNTVNSLHESCISSLDIKEVETKTMISEVNVSADEHQNIVNTLHKSNDIDYSDIKKIELKIIEPDVFLSFLAVIKLPEKLRMYEINNGKMEVHFITKRKGWFDEESNLDTLQLSLTNNILKIQSSCLKIPFLDIFYFTTCPNRFSNLINFRFLISLINKETSEIFRIEMQIRTQITFMSNFNFCYVEYFVISEIFFGSITDEPFIETNYRNQRQSILQRNLYFPISNYSISKRKHDNNFFSSISTMKIMFDYPHLTILDRVKNPKPIYTMMRIISQKRCLKYIFNSSDILTLGFLFGGIKSLLQKSHQGFWLLPAVIDLIR